MEFFKRCMDRGVTTDKEKAAILLELAQEGKMLSVTATNKTKEEYITDKAKHFKILKIEKKES